MPVTLRPYSEQDKDFMFQLYANIRRQEVSAWGWDNAQQEAFLRMQFGAQQRWYETAYPGADHQLILLDGKPVGRLYVFREKGKIHLVDIAVLTEHRNQGIGTRLVHALVVESDQSGVPIRLQVLKTNPALHLYQRAGFVQSGEDELYYQMEYQPIPSRA